MIQKVLVGSDGSKTAALAVDRAVELAQAFGASLTILTAGTGKGARQVVEREAGRHAGAGVDIDTRIVGRDPATFPISKRVFLSVDERADVARAELHRWFSTVYRNPAGTDASGVHGTPEQVREQLEELVALGANHLLLNPVGRYAEQLEALATIVGLRASAASAR